MSDAVTQLGYIAENGGPPAYWKPKDDDA